MTFRPTLEVLEDRTAPSASPTYHGGPLIPNVQADTIFMGAWTAQQEAQVNAETSALTGNPYAASWAFTGAGPGSLNASISAGPANASDGAVQATIKGQIAAGNLPRPDNNQLYVVFTGTGGGPLGTAYHSSFNYQGAVVPYAVVPGDPASPQALSLGLSHEIAEAVTDPAGNGWYAGSSSTGEIGDLSGKAQVLDGMFVANVVGADGNQVPIGPDSINPNVNAAVPKTLEQAAKAREEKLLLLDWFFASQGQANYAAALLLIETKRGLVGPLGGTA